MTDEDALLAAIAANPDDDTVRLAYADFLEERGGEVNAARAEYIRIQCERASGRGDRERRTMLLKRSMQLFQEFARAWFARDWPDAEEQAVTGYSFDRGFVDSVSMVRRGLRDADILRITRSCPLLALIRTWGLSLNQIGDDGLRAIAECPRAARLRTLGLLGNPFTIRGLEALAASPHLGSLAELSIGYWVAPGPCDMQVLANPDHLQVQVTVERIQNLFRRHGKTIRVII
jgi:uncharacterized protein (TIGR02996 family)